MTEHQRDIIAALMLFAAVDITEMSITRLMELYRDYRKAVEEIEIENAKIRTEEKVD